MTVPRRDFLKGAAAAGLGATLGAAPAAASPTPGSAAPRPQDACDDRWTHTVLEEQPDFIWVDPCMQIWPDGDFENAHRHGVTAYGVTAWNPHADVRQATDGIMYWHGIARQHPNLEVVRTVADIRRMKREGKAGLLLAAQDGDWIGHEVGRVHAMADMGLRMMLLAYNANNQLAGGCLDRTDGGLSRLGQRVVEECNRAGVVLDLSHTGRRSTLEIVERSAQPCIFSHSNPDAIVPNPRNIDDEQIRACADAGGVVGLVSWGPLCFRPGQATRPTIDDFIDTIDYVVELMGSVDHVAISTDMSIGSYPEFAADPFGGPDYPDTSPRYDELITANPSSPLRQVEGFGDFAGIVQVAERLSARGYGDEEVDQVLSGNLFRVFEEVWGG